VRLLLQGLNDTQKFLIQLAACCRWFDAKLIRHLTEKEGLDFAAAVDEERNCYGWLTQLSFAEPVGKHWRLDDVARDVFRQSLDREDLSRIHGYLADAFLARSNQEVDPNGPPSDQYENPDWRELRSEYLYHLLFAEPVASQQPFLTHLLEARYFRKDDVVKTPFQTIVGEFELDKHPLLRYRQQQFLGQVRPAVLHGWAVLEESPIDYDWNEKYLKLSKVDTDQAITLCLGHPEQFTGLAQVLALYYRSRRCPEDLAASLLLQAYDQALLLSQTQPAPYLADLYFWKLGNALFNLGQYEAAIAAYDQALKIKPDDHEALNNKGIALRRLGQYEAAIAAYDQALAIKPDQHEAWDNKGCALATQGRFDEAIACFDKATSINPQYANAIYNKAYAVSKLGDLDEALALLQKAIALDPKYREMAKTDTDFDPIRHDERFRALVEGS
jgi:tetratricopeptide (TPR) repeat protein